MSNPLVSATWHGPADGHLLGRVIRRGETALVTEGDLLSAHWRRAVAAFEPVVQAPDKTPTDRSDD